MNTDLLINLLAFSVLALLWVGFGAALLFNKELLDQAWRKFRSWPLMAQLAVWLVFLPVVFGLWIWQTHWPVWLRLTLVVSLALVTLYTFFPQLPLV